jgi:tRNA nucleotidyltransferase (CCA-adding enzyme)
VIGYSLESGRQPAPLDEHLFAVVQGAADVDAELEVRLCALLHDLGKPEAARVGGGHVRIGAVAAGRIMRHLRYPNVLRQEVTRLVAGHSFRLEGPIDARFARRFLASHGLERSRRLIVHKRADLAAKNVAPWENEHLDELERAVEEQRAAPHRLAHLAIDGTDLIGVGYVEGPALGATLARLLDDVVDDPALNDRQTLLDLARQWRS